MAESIEKFPASSVAGIAAEKMRAGLLDALGIHSVLQGIVAYEVKPPSYVRTIRVGTDVSVAIGRLSSGPKSSTPYDTRIEAATVEGTTIVDLRYVAHPNGFQLPLVDCLLYTSDAADD